MTGAWRESGTGRRWVFALAALAVLLQVLSPPGFMLSGEPAAPGLVICTGHGPLLGHADHDKAPKSSNAPCAFGVHGGTTDPPAPVFVALAPVAFEARVEQPVLDVAPGRGLAAPPPPSQAPPIAPV